MARIRTIKPEFPQSESMGRVSREARLCFIMLWTVVDDAGRTRASSRMLASLLYPYDEDAGSLMDGWLEELEREHCVVRYSLEGNSYLEISKWLNHQKIDKPSVSRLPAFVEGSRIVANAREESATYLVPSTVVPRKGVDHLALTSAEVPASVFDLPLPGKQGEWQVPQTLYEQLLPLYPSVSVMGEFAKMRGWLLTNPTKRKTARGLPAFIGNWLNKSQNAPKQNGGSNGHENQYEAARRRIREEAMAEGEADDFS